ncbi:MAG: tRNA (N(6)-L-threonylcarbamoyladenosine(37)-C(2))-methylthiotransferase MtaB [Saprospiraceae bacterium]|nr:tRNA (N(6)-L-threonylcarbamoyladenosine(37)-C(2))-methylthiotransferase MtaB [Saprospiraceae bacterium]
MATQRTVAFHTLGCKLNYAESSSIGKLFLRAGYAEVPFHESSDLYVINTCSVTDQADRKCRKAVRMALRLNPGARIIVVGCYAQLKPAEIASIPGVSAVLGAAEKFDILRYIDPPGIDPLHVRTHSLPIGQLTEFVPGHSIEGRTRSFLKIQDGCNYKCTYCTIPLARGRSRSGSLEMLVETVRSLARSGVREIVLTGVNIGDYRDPESPARFLQLVRAFDKTEEPCRFRISSIEPNLCSDALIDFVFSSQKFMPHFHMPLQSGDDTVLARMQRRYPSALYADRVARIRSEDPYACIGADVIVGFPGEEDAHFQNSYEFIRDLELSYLHVFSYSERTNTPAADMACSIPPSVRRERSQMLRILSGKMKRSFYEKQAGSLHEVLFESAGADGLLEGWTRNYLRVAAPLNPEATNCLVRVKLDVLRPDCVYASLPAPERNDGLFESSCTRVLV